MKPEHGDGFWPWFGLVLLVLAGLGTGGCRAQESTSSSTSTAPPAARPGDAVATLGHETALPDPYFVDATEAAGLDFVHFNGMSGDFTLAEEMGAGGALVDFDQDGDLDLYLVQGTMLGGKPITDATFQPAHPVPLRDRVYRNDLAPGVPRFVDVTASSGAVGSGYGMGVAVGDVDNDGWPDLYITNDGPNQLLRNRGVGEDGRHRGFEDISASSGADDASFSVPAVFIDFDRDGWLDLYVGNYVHVPATAPVCRLQSGSIDYCGPASYTPAADRLLRNRGLGNSGAAIVFEDATAAAQLDAAPAPALGAAVLDANHDGWPDLYVANDDAANHLWINDGTGTFTDTALLAGAAVDGDGRAQGSMGIVTDDLDGDGDVDIFLTHRITETNTFYRNDGAGLFDDATHGSGLGPASRRFTAFGTGALDVNHDGLLDLLIVNGAVNTIEAQVVRGDPHPLHEPDQLFVAWRNTAGNVVFDDASERGGLALAVSRVGRGLALGDVDNDGDTDAVVINNAGPARLLINAVGQGNAWLGLRLVAPGSAQGPARDQPGTRVALLRDGTPVAWRRVATDGSYGSARDPRVRFGLGTPATGTEETESRHDVQVHWPDGLVEVFGDLRSGEYHALVRGEGIVERRAS